MTIPPPAFLPVTMDFMVAITAAVKRAAPDICLVADMPFLSYHVSPAQAVENAGRFVKEAGASIIKIEAGKAQLDAVKAVSDAEMSVMAHIGIRPQSITKLGKLKAEGTSAQMAYDLIELADDMIKAGASSILLEGAAREVAKIITDRIPAPVISCGAGPDCDGQILLISDVLGLSQNPSPKFAKNYASLADETVTAVKKYAQDIRAGSFPDDQHSYHIKPGQLEKLQKMIENLPQ